MTQRTDLLAAASDALDIGAVGELAAADRLRWARQKAARPRPVVALVGAHKHGKSTLFNTLIGRDVSAVDPATSTETLVIAVDGNEPGWVTRDRSDARKVSRDTALDAMRSPVRDLQVEVTVPDSELLGQATLVDTPSLPQRVDSAPARLRDLLSHVDGVVYVRDAGRTFDRYDHQLLSELQGSHRLIAIALSKADLYLGVEERAIELQRSQSRSGPPVPVIPCGQAGPWDGQQLGRLLHDFAEQAQDLATEDLRVVLRETLQSADSSLGAQAAALESAGVDTMAALEQARRDLRLLTEDSGSWRQELADRFGRLGDEYRTNLQVRMRAELARLDEEVAALRRPEAEQFRADAEQRLIDVVHRISEELTDGIEQLIADLSRKVRDAAPPGIAGMLADEAAAEWRTSSNERQNGALHTIRNAQGGIVSIGILGGLLPASVGAFVLAPVAIVATGLLVGTGAIRGHLQRRNQAMRSVLRASMRQYADDLTVATNGSLAVALRESQRHVRDHFASRFQTAIEAQQRLVTELESDAGSDGSERRRRHVAGQRQQIGQLMARVTDAVD